MAKAPIGWLVSDGSVADTPLFEEGLVLGRDHLRGWAQLRLLGYRSMPYMELPNLHLADLHCMLVVTSEEDDSGSDSPSPADNNNGSCQVQLCNLSDTSVWINADPLAKGQTAVLRDGDWICLTQVDEGTGTADDDSLEFQFRRGFSQEHDSSPVAATGALRRTLSSSSTSSSSSSSSNLGLHHPTASTANLGRHHTTASTTSTNSTAAASGRYHRHRDSTNSTRDVQLQALSDHMAHNLPYCPMCTGLLDGAVQLTPCGHAFCATCLSKHLGMQLQAAVQLTCPLGCPRPLRVIAATRHRSRVDTFILHGAPPPARHDPSPPRPSRSLPATTTATPAGHPASPRQQQSAGAARSGPAAATRTAGAPAPATHAPGGAPPGGPADPSKPGPAYAPETLDPDASLMDLVHGTGRRGRRRGGRGGGGQRCGTRGTRVVRRAAGRRAGSGNGPPSPPSSATSTSSSSSSRSRAFSLPHLPAHADSDDDNDSDDNSGNGAGNGGRGFELPDHSWPLPVRVSTHASPAAAARPGAGGQRREYVDSPVFSTASSGGGDGSVPNCWPVHRQSTRVTSTGSPSPSRPVGWAAGGDRHRYGTGAGACGATSSSYCPSLPSDRLSDDDGEGDSPGLPSHTWPSPVRVPTRSPAAGATGMDGDRSGRISSGSTGIGSTPLSPLSRQHTPAPAPAGSSNSRSSRGGSPACGPSPLSPISPLSWVRALMQHHVGPDYSAGPERPPSCSFSSSGLRPCGPPPGTPATASPAGASTRSPTSPLAGGSWAASPVLRHPGSPSIDSPPPRRAPLLAWLRLGQGASSPSHVDYQSSTDVCGGHGAGVAPRPSHDPLTCGHSPLAAGSQQEEEEEEEEWAAEAQQGTALLGLVCGLSPPVQAGRRPPVPRFRRRSVPISDLGSLGSPGSSPSPDMMGSLSPSDTPSPVPAAAAGLAVVAPGAGAPMLPNSATRTTPTASTTNRPSPTTSLQTASISRPLSFHSSTLLTSSCDTWPSTDTNRCPINSTAINYQLHLPQDGSPCSSCQSSTTHSPLACVHVTVRLRGETDPTTNQPHLPPTTTAVPVAPTLQQTHPFGGGGGGRSVAGPVGRGWAAGAASGTAAAAPGAYSRGSGGRPAGWQAGAGSGRDSLLGGGLGDSTASGNTLQRRWLSRFNAADAADTSQDSGRGGSRAPAAAAGQPPPPLGQRLAALAAAAVGAAGQRRQPTVLAAGRSSVAPTAQRRQPAVQPAAGSRRAAAGAAGSQQQQQQLQRRWSRAATSGAATSSVGSDGRSEEAMGAAMVGAAGACAGLFKSPPGMHVLCALHDFRLPMDLASWRTSLVERVLLQLRMACGPTTTSSRPISHASLVHTLEMLARLAWNSPDSKESLAAGGVIQKLMAVMRQFSGSAAVQAAGCMAMAGLVYGVGDLCLTNQWDIAKALGVEVITAAMTTHTGEPMLQLAALISCIPLCVGNPMMQANICQGALPTILSALRTHKDEAAVQAKGMVLLGVMVQGEEQLLDAIRTCLIEAGVTSHLEQAMTSHGATSDAVLWPCLFCASLLTGDGKARMVVSSMARSPRLLSVVKACLAAHVARSSQSGLPEDELIMSSGLKLVRVLEEERARQLHTLMVWGGAAAGLAVAAMLCFRWYHKTAPS